MDNNNQVMKEQQSYTEAVQAALRGEQQGFRALYDMTHREKFYIAMKYMKDESAAQDVMQDAYVKAFKTLSTLEDAEKFPAWFGMIVANTALDALKAARRQPLLFAAMAGEDEEGGKYDYEIEDVRPDVQPELSYTKQEANAILRGLIDTLTDEQRMCVLMHYIEEIPIKEIAHQMACSENTVKTRLHYARKNLKEGAVKLEKQGYKLYGIAPVHLLILLIFRDRISFRAPLPGAGSAATSGGGVSSGAGGSAASGAGGSAASGTGGGALSGAGGSAASGMGGSAFGGVGTASGTGGFAVAGGAGSSGAAAGTGAFGVSMHGTGIGGAYMTGAGAGGAYMAGAGAGAAGVAGMMGSAGAAVGSGLGHATFGVIVGKIAAACVMGAIGAAALGATLRVRPAMDAIMKGQTAQASSVAGFSSDTANAGTTGTQSGSGRTDDTQAGGGQTDNTQTDDDRTGGTPVSFSPSDQAQADAGSAGGQQPGGTDTADGGDLSQGENWSRLYTAYLTEHEAELRTAGGQERTFRIVYIDDNDIPEIVVSGGAEAEAGMLLLSCADGYVTDLNLGTRSDTAKLYLSERTGGILFTEAYTNGGVELVCALTDGEFSFAFRGNTDVGDDGQRFWEVDGEATAHAEYETTREQMVDRYGLKDARVFDEGSGETLQWDELLGKLAEGRL